MENKSEKKSNGESFAIIQETKSLTDQLMDAAYSGNVELMSSLVNSGISINSKNEFQQTTLHLAVLSAVPEAVEFCLDKKANILARDINQENVLHLCAKYNLPDIANLIIKTIDDNTRFILIAVNKIGVTAALVAKQEKHEKMYELLMSSLKICNDNFHVNNRYRLNYNSITLPNTQNIVEELKSKNSSILLKKI